MNSTHQRLITVGLCLVLFGWATGCTSGPLKVHEVYFYKTSNGRDANYFRLTVKAKTQLGNAEYRSGWFPKRSVDSLFGEATDAGGNKANEFRESIVNLINTNVYQTTKRWLDAVATNAPANELERLNQARINVLTYPQLAPTRGMVIMDYNSMAGIVREHADEKFVMLLSSNPDEIVGKIAAFTEQEKTAATVQKLASTFTRQRADEILGRIAVERERQKWDLVMFNQLHNASTSLDPTNSTKDEVIELMERLTKSIEATKN